MTATGKIAIELETPALLREETAAKHVLTKPKNLAEEGEMMKKWYSLIDKVYRMCNLREAYRQVRANRGAPGIDSVTVEAFGEHLEEEHQTSS